MLQRDVLRFASKVFPYLPTKTKTKTKTKILVHRVNFLGFSLILNLSHLAFLCPFLSCPAPCLPCLFASGLSFSIPSPFKILTLSLSPTLTPSRHMFATKGLRGVASVHAVLAIRWVLGLGSGLGLRVRVRVRVRVGVRVRVRVRVRVVVLSVCHVCLPVSFLV